MVFRHLANQKDAVVDEKYVITNILYGLKRFSAISCNKVLTRKGAFWQAESFDRLIRDENELERVIQYTLFNPVKASLAEDWQKWPFTYCKPEFLETFT
ncbi:MAG: hypothetical protein WD604_01775 [Balneolaceae bacterium]